MKVKEVMTRSVETISPDATVEQAARIMLYLDIGILPVVDEGNLLGVVTDRDLVIRGLAVGRPSHLTVVRQVMTTKVQTCYEHQSITEITKLMQKNRVRRLLVLNRKGGLVGVVSLSDLALRLANERISGHVLSRISTAA
jgi:CBS domain-containing protein